MPSFFVQALAGVSPDLYVPLSLLAGFLTGLGFLPTTTRVCRAFRWLRRHGFYLRIGDITVDIPAAQKPPRRRP